MESDPSPLRLHNERLHNERLHNERLHNERLHNERLQADPQGGTTRPRGVGVLLPPPAASGSLADDADGLIRALFACGFTSAAVQNRVDVGADLSDRLTCLIDTLDEAIRGIRRALTAYEAA